MEREDWDMVTHMLAVRSGSTCEVCGRPFIPGVREPNRHHRRPRGMGGTSQVDVHLLSNLLLICAGRSARLGGVAGCHGAIESHREDALARGILVPQGHDPADVPFILPSGRAVLLDPVGPLYIPIHGVESYWLGGPVPFVEPRRAGVVKP
jgi:5-methylcytosine-specific restriction enzyme A